MPPLCRVCGDPLLTWRTTTEDRCPVCRATRTRIALGRSLGEYDGTLRTILHALKYDGRRAIAPVLSAMMRAHGQSVLTGADCVVPVPLHWLRRWRRGFNQAAVLAAGLGPPVVHALRRTRVTRTQTDLPAHERHANVRDAFRVDRPARIVRARVVLVDDVSTTGATLEACAEILRAGGATDVSAVTAARVVSQPPE
jgi:ComF family protein